MPSIKERLNNGENIIGTMITVIDHPDMIKVVKSCGFDLAILDCEHGSMGYNTVAAMLGLARAMNFPLLVRIPNCGREAILKYSDAGAAGFLLPNCDTPEQAKALVDHAKYAPQGNRGVAMLRAHANYERPESAVAYMEKANADCLLLCQIESSTAVENIDSILGVDGVDAAFIGPNDLSQSYGLMGQFEHPVVVGAIEKVIASAQKHGKHRGIHLAGPTDALKGWIAKGMNLNLWGNEIAMMQASGSAAVKQIR